MPLPAVTWSRLMTFVVVTVITCLMVWNGAQGQEEAATPTSGIRDINLSTWQQSYNENQKLLVSFYKTDGCERCTLALDSTTQIVGQPETPTGLEIVKSADPDLVSHLRIIQFPSLVYLREQSFVTYDGNYGVEDLLEWVQLATSRATHTLNDDSFEHLTQASTGATTGDWLVAFYKDSCKNVLPVLETLGVRIRGRINVAIVSIPDSPGLVERFKVAECPEVIYFKQGKMYRYILPNLDVPSLRSFVDGFYKNVQAQLVPIPKSQFDFLTEGIADFIKVHLEGENKTVVLAGLSGLAISFVLIIFFCCRSTAGEAEKRKTE